MSSSVPSDVHHARPEAAPTERWRLPGLADDPGSADAAWLHHLVHAPDERIAQRFTQLAIALREPPGLRSAVASLLGEAEAEVAASPFSLRACAWAANEGFFSVHHELRMPVPWPVSLEGGAEVHDPRHGTWEEGRLLVGKYRSFLQDEMVVVRDPNHHAKWTPHELLHRVMRFLWRPGVSSRELYLGARLNELLPVVLWYGLDEVLRLDGVPFRREASTREPEAQPSRAQWWTLPAEGLMDRARVEAHAFRAAIDHYRHEMDAIATEIGSAETVRVPHPFLDASSDAMAYVAGHHRRLRAPAVTLLLDTLTVSGRDRDTCPRDAWRRVHAGLQHLLYGEIVLDSARARIRATGRALFDLLHRAAHTLEDVIHPFFRLLPEARETLDAALEGTRAVDLVAWTERVGATLGDGSARLHALSAGHRGRSLSGPAKVRLVEGLRSCLPATLEAMTHATGSDRWLEAFVTSAAFSRRRALPVRLGDWIAEADSPPMVCEVAAFERALLEVGEPDGAARWLGLPAEDIEDPEAVMVRAGAGYRLLKFSGDVVAAHEAMVVGQVESAQRAWEAMPVTLLLGASDGGVVVVPVPEAVGEAWSTLAAGSCRLPEWMERLDGALSESPGALDSEGWMDELLGAGAVVMVPVWPSEELQPDRCEGITARSV